MLKQYIIQESGCALNISFTVLDFNHLNGKNPNVGKYWLSTLVLAFCKIKVTDKYIFKNSRFLNKGSMYILYISCKIGSD